MQIKCNIMGIAFDCCCFLSFLILLATEGINGDLIVRPHDTTIDLGQTARFSCKTSETDPVNWVFRGTPSSATRPIYAGGNIAHDYAERCTVKTTVRGEYILIMHDTVLEDSGTYTCIDNAGLGPEQATAQLTILIPTTPPVAAGSSFTQPSMTSSMSQQATHDVDTTKIVIVSVFVVGALLAVAVVLVPIVLIIFCIRRLRKSDATAIETRTLREKTSLLATQMSELSKRLDSTPALAARVPFEVQQRVLPFISGLPDVVSVSDKGNSCSSSMNGAEIGTAAPEMIDPMSEMTERVCDQARSSLHIPVTYTVKRRKIAVPLPCPLAASNRCSNTTRTWQCERCSKTLLYDENGNFHCDCGQAKCESFEFRCNDAAHGREFAKFNKEILAKYLADSKRTLNILLLGETGVGKSTWINGLFNYLQFESLERAKTSPVFLIPVFFTTTIPDTDRAVVVATGRSENEQHLEGDRATLKAMTHHLLYDGISINIIDTPGICDRGNHDEASFFDIKKHLMDFYTEIHGICILLKPNSKRNVAFESCITQLVELVPRYAQKNIIICFTHSKETQYCPGDTLPILRTLLARNGVTLVLDKTTMYCTDNEAVRYLATLNAALT